MLKQRNQALKDAMGRLPRGAENATYLKYPGFQETEGKPMTIRRAAAFRSLLAGYEKILYPQDLIAGSLNGLAAAVKDSEFDEKVRYVQSFSERSFLTNADHAAPNYEKLLRVGVGGLLQEVEQSIKHHGDDGEKLAFLQSVKIALEGFADFIRGYQKAAADDGSEALKALWQN